MKNIFPYFVIPSLIIPLMIYAATPTRDGSTTNGVNSATSLTFVYTFTSLCTNAEMFVPLSGDAGSVHYTGAKDNGVSMTQKSLTGWTALDYFFLTATQTRNEIIISADANEAMVVTAVGLCGVNTTNPIDRDASTGANGVNQQVTLMTAMNKTDDLVYGNGQAEGDAASLTDYSGTNLNRNKFGLGTGVWQDLQEIAATSTSIQNTITYSLGGGGWGGLALIAIQGASSTPSVANPLVGQDLMWFE